MTTLDKCCFLLAEVRKKQKTFFSHTSGSLGASVWAHEIAHFFCCRSPLPDLSTFSVWFLRVFVRRFVHSVMGKDRPRQSRALCHLEAYNKRPHGRPKDRASGSSGDVCIMHNSSVGSSGQRSKSHGSRGDYARILSSGEILGQVSGCLMCCVRVTVCHLLAYL